MWKRRSFVWEQENLLLANNVFVALALCACAIMDHRYCLMATGMDLGEAGGNHKHHYVA